MSRVLVLANEHVGQRMAGPAIRSYELSRALHDAHHEVTLGSAFPSDIEDAPFDIVSYDDQNLPGLVESSEIVVLQGWVLERFPWIAERTTRIVVDLYDPFPLEVLVLFDRYDSEKRWETSDDAVRAVNDQILRGDFFMCASEKQFDFWCGWLTGAGRVNPATYRSDPSLRSLIDVVPFGVPSVAPMRRRRAVRETFPQIGADDTVLLWGGGIYNWFDPVTLIRAVAAAVPDHRDVRLVFMSTGHSNPDIQPMWTMTEARRVARESGMEGKNVFFNDTWVDYADRADWLLDADVGVSTHFDHVETRFSFRTRVLDYFWAGLPVICTAGDTLATTISERGLGFTVPAEDVPACADAIRKLAASPELRREQANRAREHARSLTWSEAAGPLIRYCDGAARAADRVAPRPAERARAPVIGHRANRSVQSAMHKLVRRLRRPNAVR